MRRKASCPDQRGGPVDAGTTTFGFADPAAATHSTRPLDEIGQPAAAPNISGDTDAVVGDVDDELVGDGDLHGEVTGTGVPHAVADRLADDRLGLVGQVAVDDAQRPGQPHGDQDAGLIGQSADQVEDTFAKVVGGLSRSQGEDGGADVLDRVVQVVDGLAQPPCDLW